MVIQVTMDFFQHRYYRINKILLTLIGQWPYQTTRSSLSMTAMILFLTTTQMIPQLLVIVKYRNNLALLSECISPLIFFIFIFVRLICFICNSQKLLKLLDRIPADWQIWAREPEENILHEYAQRGRKMTIAHGATIYVTGILFIIQPVVLTIIDTLLTNGSKPKQYPIPFEFYYIDMQKYYFYIMMYVLVTVSGGLLVIVACSSIFFINVQHVCGLFAALGCKLERIVRNSRWREAKEVAERMRKEDVDFKELILCINRHNDAIKYASLIEETYCWCFFFVVGLTVFTISILSIQIMGKTHDPQETFRFIAWLMADMGGIYIESYLAQLLMDHSISIRNSIHGSKWYSLSPKAQKLLQFMIMRCNFSCSLTAGRIINMSMETLAAIIKTSISYFTLMRSMKG